MIFSLFSAYIEEFEEINEIGVRIYFFDKISLKEKLVVRVEFAYFYVLAAVTVIFC